MSTPDEVIRSFADRIANGGTLSLSESGEAFTAMMSGSVAEPQIEDFLTAMARRLPTAAEIAGGAATLRKNARAISAPEGAVDIVGTGGDGHDTLNVSTATAFVVAACGVPVAKHGNRAASSRAGSADVLESLGVNLQMSPSAAERCLTEAGLCFLFAQNHHPAMKHVAGVRKKLKFRTIFNLLGPLSNPAHVKRQVLGVYDAALIAPMAEALRDLGAVKAWVVCGADGMDEITTTGETDVAMLEAGAITRIAIAPEDFGLPRARLADLKGGDARDNADAIRALLAGAKTPFRDIVLFNAAAALVVADKTPDIAPGLAEAARAIDSGGAAGVLDRLVRVSREATA